VLLPEKRRPEEGEKKQRRVLPGERIQTKITVHRHQTIVVPILTGILRSIGDVVVAQAGTNVMKYIADLLLPLNRKHRLFRITCGRF